MLRDDCDEIYDKGQSLAGQKELFRKNYQLMQQKYQWHLKRK